MPGPIMPFPNGNAKNSHKLTNQKGQCLIYTHIHTHTPTPIHNPNTFLFLARNRGSTKLWLACPNSSPIADFYTDVTAQS